MTETIQIAQTILAQLGGRKFIVMTGAKNFMSGNNQLTFRLPCSGGFCKDGINCVRVTLEPSDTYKVDFLRIRGVKVTTVASIDDVYNDMLREVFERYTGLRTSL